MDDKGNEKRLRKNELGLVRMNWPATEIRRVVIRCRPRFARSEDFHFQIDLIRNLKSKIQIKKKVEIENSNDAEDDEHAD